MPIEIRELIIRTNIIDDRQSKTVRMQTPVNEREIVDRCVERILKKLNKKTTR